MGLSQRATVLAIYSAQIVLGAIAAAMINASFVQFLALLLIVGILAVFTWSLLVKVEAYSIEENGREY